jgi:hypothetical protein
MFCGGFVVFAVVLQWGWGKSRLQILLLLEVIILECKGGFLFGSSIPEIVCRGLQ